MESKASANGIKTFWKFLHSNDGRFETEDPQVNYEAFFPLLNSAGMKSWVTPQLKGDILKSFSQYLSPPTVTEEIHRTAGSRNIWIRKAGKEPWSVSGMNVVQKAKIYKEDHEETVISGVPGCFTLESKNSELGLDVKTDVFIPENEDFVELMLIAVTNTSDSDLNFDLTYALPLFGRHADNFRDHRQVTTMFQKNFTEDYGIRIKPNIVHDEHGHRPNKTNYFVAGFDPHGEVPQDKWSLMNDFIGKGSLDNPEAIFTSKRAPNYANGDADGQEAVAAFRFKPQDLKKGGTVQYVVLHGISEDEKDIGSLIKKYNTASKSNTFKNHTTDHWEKYTSSISVHTSNKSFDEWVKWIIYQVKCRQIFGNSYLPDFSYGRGGRGWRDLWQDLLSIFLVDPESAREEIINGLKGVRIDGSNATIIGTEPGTFVADRNNVPRTWCDHGSWPAFVINFYIDQTGDLDILFKEVPFWKDQFINRSKKRDGEYDDKQGPWQKTQDDTVYESSIFEHLLIQQLSAFYNVGDHNILLLEGGDWNDTYDMAREKGESVGFYAFYAENLKILASWLTELSNRGVEHIYLLKEVSSLIQTNGKENLYTIKEKRRLLNNYFKQVAHHVSGDKTKVGIQSLILDLMLKSEHITNTLRDQEWLPLCGDKGFYNGHYDNKGNAVDGSKGDRVMMDLTTQVMVTMNDVATKDQVRSILKSADRYLKDDRGYRLCTPFPGLDLNVGRISGFVYGNKEHGSKWMQQNIMLAYGLLRQGFKTAASEILDDAFILSTNSARSKIFPGLPSYFGPNDKGSYSYLTGSSSWFMLTLATQLFGIRGDMGNLCIEPKLSHRFFDDQGKASITFTFRGIRFLLIYKIQQPANSNAYHLDGITINEKDPVHVIQDGNRYLLDYETLKKTCITGNNQIIVSLS